MSVQRFSTCRFESGGWAVMDQTLDRATVMHLSDRNRAEWIAAMMNGDLCSLQLLMTGCAELLIPQSGLADGLGAIPQS